MKLFLSLLILIFGALSFLIYNFGLQPKAVPVIKWSQFNDLREWSEAVVSRSLDTLKNDQILLLGVDPNRPEHGDFVVSLIQEFERKAYHFDVVAVDSRLSFSHSLNTPNYFDFSKPIEIVVSGLKEAKSKNLRTLLIAPSVNVSHLIKEHGVRDLETQLGQGTNLAVISIADFPLTAEQEPNMTWKCVADHVDPLGTSDYACHILYAARAVYHKKHDPSKAMGGWMERTGEKDFLVFYRKL